MGVFLSEKLELRFAEFRLANGMKSIVINAFLLVKLF